MIEDDTIEQFRQMDREEQAKLLRNLDKYPASISVLEGFVMIGEYFEGEPRFEVEPIDQDGSEVDR